MNTSILKIYLAIVVSAFCYINLSAQGWLKTYPGILPTWGAFNNPILFQDIEQTIDGGYITLSTDCPEECQSLELFLTKLDVDGNVQWNRNYSFDNPLFLSGFQNFSITSTNDGGILGIGSYINYEVGFPNWENQTKLVKFNEFGDTLWTKTYPTTELSSIANIRDIITTPDNDHLLIASQPPWMVDSTFSHWVTKLDASGNILWQNHYEYPYYSILDDISASEDGLIAFSGHIIDTTITENAFAYVLDENGSEVWYRTDNIYIETYPDFILRTSVDFHTSGDILFHQLKEVPYTLIYTANSKLSRITPSNSTLWDLEHSNIDDGFYISDFCALSNGNIGIVGNDSRIFDENANLLSTTSSISTSSFLPFDYLDLICSQDNSIIVSGMFHYYPPPYPKPFIAKIDENGEIFTSQISGYIYQDINENCELEDGENGLEGYIVELSPAGFYTITDSTGFYQIDVNEGVYTINSYLPPNDPWNLWDYTCADTFLNVVIANYDTLINENIGINPIIECPILEVNVGVNLLRRCFENTVHIYYENVGTDDAENAYITVELDEAILLDSASVDYTIEDGLYVFYIGDVAMWESGHIQLIVTVDCDAELGTTSCIQANAYPNDFCGEISQLWDGSNIEVGATCEGDSIEFYLRNIGDDMEEIRYYTIYEDDLLQGIEPFDLDMNEIHYFKVATNGATYRMQAQQSDYFPSFSMPQVIVEMCNDEAISDISMGFITSTPPDDLDPFVDIECHEISGSFDPNDKLVSPKGIGDNHYINSEEMLDYTIRFQNTGNDTAFNIFVIDTLSHFLDINSFVSGVSSHDYTISFTGDRVVRWDFSNILLPDSTTNLVESNGFVKFKIKVATDVPQETEIHNIADIYFDFNEPIRTPDIFVTVCDDCVDQHRTRYLNAKVFLEGAYNNSNAMNANLGELIPLVQPYRNMPYIYYGNEELNEIPNEMVDWVLVEARLGEPAIFGQRNTTTTEIRAALLMSDGSITDLDGISPVPFNMLINGNQYSFCIRHRNHLDVLTATPLELEDEMFFDFTTDINQALGSEQMKWSEDGKALLHVGDYNQDGVIQITDYDFWIQDPAVLNTYKETDGNLDGIIQLTDFDEWRKNKAKIGNIEIGF